MKKKVTAVLAGLASLVAMVVIFLVCAGLLVIFMAGGMTSLTAGAGGSGAVQTMSTCDPATQTSNNGAAGPWTSPVNGPITSPFGLRLHPVLGVYKLHDGTDFGGDMGTPVYAAAAGTATVESNTAYGAHFVTIRHGGGVMTQYGHMSAHTIKNGQKVKAGDRIGSIGSEGYSTGPHLHFIVQTNEGGGGFTPIDPVPFLKEHGVKPGGNAGATDTAADTEGEDESTDTDASTGTGADCVCSGVTITDVSSETDKGKKKGKKGADGGTDVPASLTMPDGMDLPTGHSTYSRRQLKNIAVGISRGKAAGLPKEAWVIGTAAVLVESEADNVRSGNADSVGLFQQRPSAGWGTRAQILDPVKAWDAFYGVAKHTDNTGLSDINWKRMDLGKAAQTVQASAYGYKYAEREAEARFLVQQLADVEFTGVDTCGATTPVGVGECPAFGNPIETDSRVQPVTVELLRCMHEQFPQIKSYGAYGERGGDTYHDDGLALDAMIPNYDSAKGRALGNQIAAWVKKNHQQLNVTQIIWNNRIWTTARADEGWRPYSHYSGATDDTSAHRDHVHVSLDDNAQVAST